MVSTRIHANVQHLPSWHFYHTTDTGNNKYTYYQPGRLLLTAPSVAGVAAGCALDGQGWQSTQWPRAHHSVPPAVQTPLSGAEMRLQREGEGARMGRWAPATQAGFLWSWWCIDNCGRQLNLSDFVEALVNLHCMDL